MSNFKAKIHRIIFRLGLCPRDPTGELTALPQIFQLDLKGQLLLLSRHRHAVITAFFLLLIPRSHRRVYSLFIRRNKRVWLESLTLHNA